MTNPEIRCETSIQLNQPGNGNLPFLRAFAILSDTASRRARVYGWLARCFFPPDEALVRKLRSRELENEIAASTAWLGKDQAKVQVHLGSLMDEREPVEDLDPEYQRVFGKSIERVVQRESAYRWRGVNTVMGDSRILRNELVAQYSQVGLTVEDGAEDSLAVELEFIAFLCVQEAAAWGNHAPLTAKAFRRRERQFVSDHLSQWVPEFTWRMMNRNPHSIYSRLASLTDTWMGLDFGPDYRSI